MNKSTEEIEIEIDADDGYGVAYFPDVVEEEAAKEYRHARLPKELIPFVQYSDKFFSPLRQQAMAEKRKIETERPKTLDEILKAEFNDPNGFQMGPLMRRAIVERMPKTIVDLEAMPFETTDMNPIVIGKYGSRILAIVAQFQK